MAKYSNATTVGTILSTTFSGSTDPTAAEVNDIAERVSLLVDAATGQEWTTATTNEFFDVWSDSRQSWTRAREGAVQTTFLMKNIPLQSVTSIQENTGWPSSVTWTSRSTTISDVIIDYLMGSVTFLRNWPAAGRQNLRVFYTYGKGTTAAADVKYAAELLVAAQVLDLIKRGTDQAGIQNVSIGGVSYNFAALDTQRNEWNRRAWQILDARRGTFLSTSR